MAHIVDIDWCQIEKYLEKKENFGSFDEKDKYIYLITLDLKMINLCFEYYMLINEITAVII